MEKQEFLPLGSIVLLHEATKRLMIYGRCQKLASTEEEFDYLACFYPEGFINPESSVVFNHSAIFKVIHRGFADDEEQELMKFMLDNRAPNTEPVSQD